MSCEEENKREKERDQFCRIDSLKPFGIWHRFKIRGLENGTQQGK